MAAPSTYGAAPITSLVFSSATSSTSPIAIPTTSSVATSIGSETYSLHSTSTIVDTDSSSTPTSLNSVSTIVTSSAKSSPASGKQSVSSTTSQELSSSSSSSSTSLTTTTTVTASFAGLFQIAGYQGTATGATIPEASVIAANWIELCPQGDCFTDCQNMTRVFESLPDGISVDRDIYGKANRNGSLPDVTLFGVCSNLASLSNLALANSASSNHDSNLARANRAVSNFASYFPATDSEAALQNVTTDIGLCLLETCQKTRDPSRCVDQCSIAELQSSDITVSIPDVFQCLLRLCYNTCGLPYANQDVFGVGVLVSYIIQAILVLILAAEFVISACWRFLRLHDNTKPKISKKLRESMETFLSAQCYFGVSAAVASFFMSPLTVDPLNGYALLSVAITGFVPTVFTMMLLHNHGIKSWYTTFLTIGSWIFSTILFFMLVANLTRTVNNPEATDRGLDALFQSDACGKSSAMSLCEQTFDTNPLEYLERFYNYWHIPSIQTVPVLWVISTVVLICLVGLQAYDSLVGRKSGGRINAIIRLASLILGAVLFGLALGYQARMVIAYTHMDVIDWDGWTFGQVVALLFWIPPILDCLKSYFNKKREERYSIQYNGYSKLNGAQISAESTPVLPSSPSPASGPNHNASIESLRSRTASRPSHHPLNPTLNQPARFPPSQTATQPSIQESSHNSNHAPTQTGFQPSGQLLRQFSEHPSRQPPIQPPGQPPSRSTNRPPGQVIEMQRISRKPLSQTQLTYSIDNR